VSVCGRTSPPLAIGEPVQVAVQARRWRLFGHNRGGGGGVVAARLGATLFCQLHHSKAQRFTHRKHKRECRTSKRFSFSQRHTFLKLLVQRALMAQPGKRTAEMATGSSSRAMAVRASNSRFLASNAAPSFSALPCSSSRRIMLCTDKQPAQAARNEV
jgi:hypothetical protein